jgi:hypothetical protein
MVSIYCGASDASARALGIAPHIAGVAKVRRMQSLTALPRDAQGVSINSNGFRARSSERDIASPDIASIEFGREGVPPRV